MKSRRRAEATTGATPATAPATSATPAAPDPREGYRQARIADDGGIEWVPFLGTIRRKGQR